MLVPLPEELNLNLDSKLDIEIQEKLGVKQLVLLLKQIQTSHVHWLLQLLKLLTGILNLSQCQLIEVIPKKFTNLKLSSIKMVHKLYGIQLQIQKLKTQLINILPELGVNHSLIGLILYTHLLLLINYIW